MSALNSLVSKRMLALVVTIAALMASMAGGKIADAQAGYGGCNGTQLARVSVNDSLGWQYGWLYVYYEGGGWNCAATVATKYVGTGKWMSVTIADSGGESYTSRGWWGYYAGPRRIYAPGQCVKAWGTIQSPTTDRVAAGNTGGWNWCD